MSEQDTDTKYVVNADGTQWRIVDGEAVVVHLASSYYYGLNRTGTLVWSLLAAAPQSIAELAGEVSTTYDITPERALADTTAVVRELASEGLIREHA